MLDLNDFCFCCFSFEALKLFAQAPRALLGRIEVISWRYTRNAVQVECEMVSSWSPGEWSAVALVVIIPSLLIQLYDIAVQSILGAR